MVSSGRNLQGVRLYHQGQHQLAVQEFQRVLASDPLNPDANYNLAALLHRSGVANKHQPTIEQAEAYYNRCLDLNKDHVDCYRGLAVLLVETKRRDKAITLLKNWAKTSPHVADSRVELARLYEEAGDLETASLHLNEALAVNANHARAWAASGALREKTGHPEQALANYQRSLQLNGFQPGVSQRVAALNRTVGGGVITGAPNGTRTVNSGRAARY